MKKTLWIMLSLVLAVGLVQAYVSKPQLKNAESLIGERIQAKVNMTLIDAAGNEVKTKDLQNVPEPPAVFLNWFTSAGQKVTFGIQVGLDPNGYTSTLPFHYDGQAGHLSVSSLNFGKNKIGNSISGGDFTDDADFGPHPFSMQIPLADDATYRYSLRVMYTNPYPVELGSCVDGAGQNVSTLFALLGYKAGGPPWMPSYKVSYPTRPFTGSAAQDPNGIVWLAVVTDPKGFDTAMANANFAISVPGMEYNGEPVPLTGTTEAPGGSGNLPLCSSWTSNFPAAALSLLRQ